MVEVNINKVKFRYFNDFLFKEDFTYQHCVGSTLVTKKFLGINIISLDIDDYQVFAFNEGVIVIYDLQGNSYVITPTSGIIDCIWLLRYFSKDPKYRSMSGYNAREFYRINEGDEDYCVFFETSKNTIKLYYKDNYGIFNLQEFIKGLLGFSNKIITWYENKYPLFINSPIRKEILDLKEKVYQLYGDSDFLTTTNT